MVLVIEGGSALPFESEIIFTTEIMSRSRFITTKLALGEDISALCVWVGSLESLVDDPHLIICHREDFK